MFKDSELVKEIEVVIDGKSQLLKAGDIVLSVRLFVQDGNVHVTETIEENVIKGFYLSDRPCFVFEHGVLVISSVTYFVNPYSSDYFGIHFYAIKRLYEKEKAYNLLKEKMIKMREDNYNGIKKLQYKIELYDAIINNLD